MDRLLPATLEASQQLDSFILFNVNKWSANSHCITVTPLAKHRNGSVFPHGRDLNVRVQESPPKGIAKALIAYPTSRV